MPPSWRRSAPGQHVAHQDLVEVVRPGADGQDRAPLRGRFDDEQVHVVGRLAAVLAEQGELLVPFAPRRRAAHCRVGDVPLPDEVVQEGGQGVRGHVFGPHPERGDEGFAGGDDLNVLA